MSYIGEELSIPKRHARHPLPRRRPRHSIRLIPTLLPLQRRPRSLKVRPHIRYRSRGVLMMQLRSASTMFRGSPGSIEREDDVDKDDEEGKGS